MCKVMKIQVVLCELVTSASLGKVYTDLQGNVRTIDKRTTEQAIVAYLVTYSSGLSEITAKRVDIV